MDRIWVWYLLSAFEFGMGIFVGWLLWGSGLVV